MLKETPRSVQRYFACLGVFYCVGGWLGLAFLRVPAVVLAVTLATFVQGIVYLHASLSFRILFPAKTRYFKAVLAFGLGCRLAGFLAALWAGVHPGDYQLMLISLAIYSYLTRSINRLSAAVLASRGEV